MATSVHYYYPVQISGFWEQLDRNRNRIVKTAGYLAIRNRISGTFLSNTNRAAATTERIRRVNAPDTLIVTESGNGQLYVGFKSQCPTQCNVTQGLRNGARDLK